MLQEKTHEVSKELEINGFKACSSWLEKLLNRRLISSKTISDKEDEANINVIDECTKHLPNLLLAYLHVNVLILKIRSIILSFTRKNTCPKNETCMGKVAKE